MYHRPSPPSALQMSHLIASDAPLLSPIADDVWDQLHPVQDTTDSLPLGFYDTPPSPPNSVHSSSTDSSIPTASMLKMRMSPDSSSETDQQLCIPTHQLFDFPDASSTAPNSPKPTRLSITVNPQSQQPPQKRTGPGSDSGATKKPRASGERISSKDFIPPDVSGLTKREARLVKNRAAAFLSRQRKREEFECMEARVAELEQENARLLALANGGRSSSGPPPESEAISAVEKLRAQLAAAEERERELSAELARKSAVHDHPQPKVEPVEPTSPLSRSNPAQSQPHKSAASLGLMVLLCALPTLLSMPTTQPLPFSISESSRLSSSSSSSAFDFLSPSEYDWSRNPGSSSLMDLDHDDHGRIHATHSTKTRKLEFVDGALGGLSGLDISFDTSPSDDGKIRVRIHSPVPSALGSSLATYASTLDSSTTTWTDSFIPTLGSALSSDPFYSTSSRDPFFGVGTCAPFGFGSHYSSDGTLPLSIYGEDGGDLSSYDSKKRRVRIALKSLPAAGGEGGEWEVQFC